MWEPQRALMSRFDEGRLAWCIVAEDVDGDGVLYHAVNSLMRNDFEEGLENGLHRTGLSFRVQLKTTVG